MTKAKNNPADYYPIEYSRFVNALKKPPGSISFDRQQTDLLHMVLGIAGEAGELVDAIKKHTVYGQPLDRPNVLEELGDLEFYLEGMRQALGISRSLVLSANRKKLSKRYSRGEYSDRQAKDRADKTDL